MEESMNKNEKTMKPFRVLTIDGGGMRGLYTASLLNFLVKRFDSDVINPDIGKSFDLICGTSTGAILACGLAAGIPLDKIRNLYIEQGIEIFPSPLPKDKGIYLWAFKHRKKPASRADVLKSVLIKTFEDLTMHQVYERRKIALCIPSVKAINHKARVFKTPHNAGKHKDNNYLLSDICLASSAAPIFFPLACQTDPDDTHNIQHYVDGGLWANNPVMVGLIEALSMAQSTQEIEIISIGTCDQPSGDPYSLENSDWGLLDWRVGVQIVEMSMSAQSYGYASMAKFLADYFSSIGRSIKIIRFDESKKSPEQYSAIGLDKADKIAISTLISLAESDADQIHSEAKSEESDELKPVVEIFENLSTL